MSIELSTETKNQAIVSIQQYFERNMTEQIGNLAAIGLLDFFVEEVGPVIYNKAVSEVQQQLQIRISEIDIEVHEDEFQYWRKADRKKKNR